MTFFCVNDRLVRDLMCKVDRECSTERFIYQEKERAEEAVHRPGIRGRIYQALSTLFLRSPVYPG